MYRKVCKLFYPLRRGFHFFRRLKFQFRLGKILLKPVGSSIHVHDCEKLENRNLRSERFTERIKDHFCLKEFFQIVNLESRCVIIIIIFP